MTGDTLLNEDFANGELENNHLQQFDGVEDLSDRHTRDVATQMSVEDCLR